MHASFIYTSHIAHTHPPYTHLLKHCSQIVQCTLSNSQNVVFYLLFRKRSNDEIIIKHTKNAQTYCANPLSKSWRHARLAKRSERFENNYLVGSQSVDAADVRRRRRWRRLYICDGRENRSTHSLTHTHIHTKI